MRTRTDIEISAVWLLLPLASYLLWAVFAIVLWSGGAGLGASDLALVFSGLGILGLSASAAASYVVYLLLNRGNMHSSRTRALLWSTIDGLGSRVGTSGAQALLPLNSAEGGLYRLARGERERSAVLWALLSLIPFVGWIFLATSEWLLTRDFAKHSRLEGIVVEDVDRTLRESGRSGISARHEPARSRDILGVAIIIVSIVEFLLTFLVGFAASLVLIYLTVGAFSLFWIDLSIRDPADHFHHHSQMEGELLRGLSETAADRVGVT